MKQPLLINLGLVFVLCFGLAFACKNDNTASTPETSLPQSNLSGTYWQLLSMTKKGEPVEDDANADVEFSKSGKWGIYRGGSGGQAGTYSVSGNRLVMKYESGGLYGSYTMTRKGEILELDDGENILRLRYSSTIDY